MKKISTILKVAIGGVAGFIIGVIRQHKEERQQIFQLQNKINKFQSYYNVLIDWMILKQSGKSLGEKILQKGYMTIAIYGMGELGKCLYADINPNSIEIKYAIDSGGSHDYETIPVVGIDGVMDNVDVIIVTAIYDFDDIKEKLENIVSCPIVSLAELIWDESK